MEKGLYFDSNNEFYYVSDINGQTFAENLEGILSKLSEVGDLNVATKNDVINKSRQISEQRKKLTNMYMLDLEKDRKSEPYVALNVQSGLEQKYLDKFDELEIPYNIVRRGCVMKEASRVIESWNVEEFIEDFESGKISLAKKGDFQRRVEMDSLSANANLVSDNMQKRKMYGGETSEGRRRSIEQHETSQGMRYKSVDKE